MQKTSIQVSNVILVEIQAKLLHSTESFQLHINTI